MRGWVGVVGVPRRNAVLLAAQWTHNLHRHNLHRSERASPVRPLISSCTAAVPQEHNDTLLAILLAAVTKGTASCNEIVDKVG